MTDILYQLIGSHDLGSIWE